MKQIQDKLLKLARQQAEIARKVQVLKERETAQKRKNKTRRLILLGHQLDQYIEKDPALYRRVLSDLDAKLYKELDRSLFGLDPSEAPPKKAGE